VRSTSFGRARISQIFGVLTQPLFFPPLASGLNGGSGVGCALGSIEHIEEVQ